MSGSCRTTRPPPRSCAARLKLASVLRHRSSPSGSQSWILSRFSASSASSHRPAPPTSGGCACPPVSRYLLSDLPNAIPSLAIFGRPRQAEDVALRGVAVEAEHRSGLDRWKKLSACDCTIWARFIMRRSFAAVRGCSTASSSSLALPSDQVAHRADAADARREDGISRTACPRRTSRSRGTAVTWKRASVTSPASSSWMRDLRVPLDAGHRVDHDRRCVTLSRHPRTVVALGVRRLPRARRRASSG